MKRDLIIAAIAMSAVVAPAYADNDQVAVRSFKTAMVREAGRYDADIAHASEPKETPVEVTYSPDTETFTLSGLETIVINPPVLH